MGRPVLLVARGLDSVGSGGELELVAAGLAAAGLPVEFAATTTGGSLPERLASRGIGVHRLGARPVVDASSVARLAGLARLLRPAAILGFGRSQAWPVMIARRCTAGSRGMVVRPVPLRRSPGLAAPSARSPPRDEPGRGPRLPQVGRGRGPDRGRATGRRDAGSAAT
jgi:hypothetical protein